MFAIRAVIISGGAIADYDFIRSQLRDGDTVICADSGYDHAVKMGVKPQVLVGDFDSIGCLDDVPSDVVVRSHSPRKDFTDTEIAIEYAREQGFKRFLLVAVLGSRVDHSLTNVLLLKRFLEWDCDAVIVDEHNKIMVTGSVLCLDEPVGSLVSLVPLTDCEGVVTDGLEYPLDGARLLVGEGLGVSNVVMRAGASVSVGKGVLLVVVARD
ncbi:MAG: thiamine diphosphokinase [Defluviitaleaceae bacterium]|nr:thiamine diphosphokinase [Defluviitaleaceae bacterium]